MMEGFPAWAVGGSAAAVAYVLARDLLIPLLQSRVGVKSSNGSTGPLNVYNKLTDMEGRLAAHFHEDSKTAKQVGELHAWHNRFDADGVPVWYGTSLKGHLDKLAGSVDGLSTEIRQLRAFKNGREA